MQISEPMFDVLVIGAGAAGLMAACELSKRGGKVVVMEAHHRIGGRMYTISDPQFTVPVELGAEFVHGDLPITKRLLAEAGVGLQPVEGSVWELSGTQLEQQADPNPEEEVIQQKLEAITNDMPLATFLTTCLEAESQRQLLQQYVEGYYAADPIHTSTLAVKEELSQPAEKEFRPRGGYRLLAEYLYRQCTQQGVVFLLNTPVKELRWQQGHAEAITAQQHIRARKALVTVSVGVLQHEGITFTPKLTEKTATARALGFGHAIKVMVQCTHSFWKERQFARGQDLHDLNFLFADTFLPTWWTHHPATDAVLTGWIGGPKAKALQHLEPEAWAAHAKQSLCTVFDLQPEQLDQWIRAIQVYNWSADPHFHGAYSYDVLNGQQLIRTMLEPVADTVYFAGEGLHTGPEIGTVEAALASGKSVAAVIAASFTAKNVA